MDSTSFKQGRSDPPPDLNTVSCYPFPVMGKSIRPRAYTVKGTPLAPGLLRFRWYNPSSIRLLTIADFREFCQELE